MADAAGTRLAGFLIVLAASTALAQSAPDLSGRMRVDGSTREFTPAEAVFRNADVCPLLVPPPNCAGDEERDGDSSWSAQQDVHQIHVTWDAEKLYLGVDGRLGGHALLVLLDFQPGGLTTMSDLLHWRRALRFGPELRPDAFLAVRDAERLPELWLVEGTEGLRRIAPEDYEARASFDADAPGRGLEAAIPWGVLFPGAPSGVDPEPGAPAQPVFVLPEASSQNGLRIAAVVVDAEDGFSGPDVAPDNTAGMPLDPRQPADVDRVARVAWDEVSVGPQHFVDFGAAVETQASARFLPEAPRAPEPGLRLEEVRTYAGGRASRLLLADAGLDLQFSFRAASPGPSVLYVSASVYSMRGERVKDLYRDRARAPASLPPPFGTYGDPALDRWDGLDETGRPVPGGIYVLRISAGTSPGAATTRVQRAITVVR